VHRVTITVVHVPCIADVRRCCPPLVNSPRFALYRGAWASLDVTMFP
jgi:hypothetical protein